MAHSEDIDTTDKDAASSGATGFLGILWQRKALVLLGAILGLVGGSLYYWQSAPVYSSSMQLLVVKKVSSVSNIFRPAVSGSVVDDFLSTHVNILKSPQTIERAIKDYQLDSLPTFDGVGDKVGLITSSLTVGRDTTSGQSSTAVSVSFRGLVADDCPKVLAAISKSFQDVLRDLYKSNTLAARDELNRANEILQTKLQTAEDDLQVCKRHSPPPIREFTKSKYSDRTKELELMRKERITKVLFIDQLEGFVHECRLAQAEKRPLPRDVPRLSPEVKETDREKMKLEKTLWLRQEIEAKSDIYAENHPLMKALKKQLEGTEELFKFSDQDSIGEAGIQAIERQIANIKRECVRLEVNSNVVKKELVDLEKAVTDINDQEILETKLSDTVKRYNALFDATAKRLKELEVMPDPEGIAAHELARPSAGLRIAPSSQKTILGGLLLGLLVGVGLAYLADMTDKSFRSPDEVRRRLALPVLGHVPLLKLDLKPGEAPPEGGLEPLLYTYFRPRSLESEAFRAIRTSLFFSTQDDDLKVLQVTSPSKGDGKSLMASNLGISMAQSGKKVLIVDADCRRPKQHKNFNVANTTGTSTIISEGTPWREAVFASPVEGLSVIPAGPIPPNAAELLSHPRFKTLLAEARGEYDFVIVDTPPLLAVTDPCVVGGLVDGLVLVLRLSRQSRPFAERARSILTEIGVKIIGVVVNGIVRQGRGGIYSSEQYEYSESYDDRETDDDYYYHYEAETSVDTKAKPPTGNA